MRARRRLVGVEGAAGGGARALERRQLGGAARAPREMRLERGAVIARQLPVEELHHAGGDVLAVDRHLSLS